MSELEIQIWYRLVPSGGGAVGRHDRSERRPTGWVFEEGSLDTPEQELVEGLERRGAL